VAVRTSVRILTSSGGTFISATAPLASVSSLFRKAGLALALISTLEMAGRLGIDVAMAGPIAPVRVGTGQILSATKIVGSAPHQGGNQQSRQDENDP